MNLSFIQTARFQFKDANNNTITFEDGDNDGIATERVSHTTMNGEYTLSQILFYDYNRNSNTTTYKFDGGGDKVTQIREGSPQKTTFGKHNFDLSSLKLTVGTKATLTDTTKPTVASIAPEKAEAKFGELFSIKYTADGTGSGIDTASINFYNADKGKMISFHDYDGDGLATKLISDTNLADGDYKFWGYNFKDEGGNSLNSGPGGTFGDVKITLKLPVDMSAAQTDFEAPELISFELVEDIA